MLDQNYIQILYDISLSIGLHTNLQQMSKEALSKYLRKLNCVAGSIEQLQHDDLLNWSCETVVQIPKRNRYQKYLDQIRSEILELKKNGPLSKMLPKTYEFDGFHFHVMDLDKFGFLVLISKREITDFDVRDLLPLNRKLAISCISCRINREFQEHLVNVNSQLETKVKMRTADLNKQKSELEEEIRNREQIQDELIRMGSELEVAMMQLEREKNKQLHQAYTAGVAENAVSVLHNIGNAITPAIVSIETFSNKRANDQLYEYLEKVSHFLTNNQNSEISQYFNQEDKGIQLISFIEDLSAKLKSKKETDVQQIADISSHLNYIRSIITSQQKYANFTEEKEQVDLYLTLSDIKTLMSKSFEQRNIIFSSTIENNLPKIHIEKNKLMQTLLNILKNSVESIDKRLLDRDYQEPKISLEIGLKDESHVFFRITDNGKGAEKGILEKAFHFGFSTKKRSSGFGLHDCANFIRANQGEILMKSEGIDLGAEVYFDFPIEVSET